MGDPAGQRPDGLELLRLPQLFVLLAKLAGPLRDDALDPLGAAWWPTTYTRGHVGHQQTQRKSDHDRQLPYNVKNMGDGVQRSVHSRPPNFSDAV